MLFCARFQRSPAPLTLPGPAQATFGSFPRDPDAGEAAELETAAFRRFGDAFPSGQDVCDAWVYLPTSASLPPPVIVMAHGLGANRDHKLPDFAAAFAARRPPAALAPAAGAVPRSPCAKC